MRVFIGSRRAQFRPGLAGQNPISSQDSPVRIGRANAISADLDTGLYFGREEWTVDPKLALTFQNLEMVADLAMVDLGDPPRVRGYLWIHNGS